MKYLKEAPISEINEAKLIQHYRVQRGDSLWKISEKLYGIGTRWQEIFDLNKDKYITGLDYSKIISSMDNEAWCNTAKASTVNPCAAAVTCEVSVTCATGYSPVSTGISDSQGCPVYACQVVPTSDTPYTPGVEESLPTSMNSVENQLADISKAVLRLVEEIAKMAGR